MPTEPVQTLMLTVLVVGSTAVTFPVTENGLGCTARLAGLARAAGARASAMTAAAMTATISFFKVPSFVRAGCEPVAVHLTAGSPQSNARTAEL